MRLQRGWGAGWRLAARRAARALCEVNMCRRPANAMVDALPVSMS